MSLADRLVSHLGEFGSTMPSLKDPNVVTVVDHNGNVSFRTAYRSSNRDTGWKAPTAINSKDIAKPHNLPSAARVIVPKGEEGERAYYGIQKRED